MREMIEACTPSAEDRLDTAGDLETLADLDVKARQSIEGHRPLGLTVLDPRTGNRVTV